MDGFTDTDRERLIRVETRLCKMLSGLGISPQKLNGPEQPARAVTARPGVNVVSILNLDVTMKEILSAANDASFHEDYVVEHLGREVATIHQED